MICRRSRVVCKRTFQAAKSGLFIPAYCGLFTPALTGKLVPHATERRVVERAFELADSGRYSLGDICMALKDEGLLISAGKRKKTEQPMKPITKDRLSKLLHNPIHKGQITVGVDENKNKTLAEREFQIFEGKHEPLVTPERYANGQQIMAARDRGGRAVHRSSANYVFGGSLLKCKHCGHSLVVATTTLRGKKHNAYRCRGRWMISDGCSADKTMISENKLIEEFQHLANRISLPKNWEEEMKRLGSGQLIEIHAARREKLRKMRSNAMTAFLNADMTEDEWNKRKAQIDEEMASLPIIPIGPQHVRQAAKIIPAFGRTWTAATPMEKRQLLRLMFRSVTIDLDTGKIIAYEPMPSFVPLLGGEKVLLNSVKTEQESR